MDSISLTSLATFFGIVGFLYAYLKDRMETSKSLGKLEQRVETLEHSQRVLEQVVDTLTETRIALSRLETKVDSISHYIERTNC